MGYWSYGHNKRECWLKSDKKRVEDVPDRISGKKRCSGCVRERYMDYPEGDIHNKKKIGPLSQQGCADECAKETKCNFWSYSTDQHLCWLKETKGGNGFIHADPNRVSGNKACGSTGGTGK